jgi:hypothetical protein
MNKRATLQLLPASERRRAGRPKKTFDLQKFDRIKVAKPASPEEAIESLLIFDARCLDREARQELLRILPELFLNHRAWKAEYMECGCISCHKKNAAYGAGGFCRACWGRIYMRMRNRYRKTMQGRDVAKEIAEFKDSLCRRYNAAQRLFGGDE